MNERELFLSALELSDAVARQSYLRSACGEDLELMRRVETLLDAHERTGEFLDAPVPEQLAAAQANSQPTAQAGATGLGNARPMPRPANQDATTDECPTAADAGSDATEFFAACPPNWLQPTSRADSLGRLGQYEILEVVGQGAFGTVLKAFDTKLQRVVAIKVLNPELAVMSPARKRFLREARAAAAIRHENVVSIHAVEESPLPHLVMEYIPGETLQHRLDHHGPLPVGDVLRLGKQIADGLAAAHAGQLIHRDVKPANILLETGVDDHVKITDFGLARTANDASLTQSGTIAGTPSYMAPEQALGLKLDQRADLFSLGSVLYQMLTGRPPFRAASALAILKRVTEDVPRPMQEIIPDIPDWLCQIVGRLHEKQPENRFASAREVGDLLARCLVELQASGNVVAMAPVDKRLQPFKKTSAPRRSGPVTKLAVATAGMLVLAATVYLMPVLRLMWQGQASVDCLNRSGETTVEFYADGQLVDTQIGYGEVDLPAGSYELRVHHPDSTLRIYDVALIRLDWLHRSHQVNLTSPPQNLRLRAGDRVKFLVSYVEQETTAPPATDAGVEDRSLLAGGDQLLTDDWIPLFNGADLSGWEPHPDELGSWHVENGLLTASGNPGYLFSTRDDFTDFHLRCEVRINAGGDAGIIARSPFQRPTKNGLPGYEAQLQAGTVLAAGWQTGAIAVSRHDRGWSILEPSSLAIAPDTWVTLEFIVIGNRIETRLSGQRIATHVDAQHLFARGRIALQHSASSTRVQFRRVEVQLPAKSPQ
ncbi:Serine/threonine-protein kinase PrkC [Stieleria neptunia]|uniref:non-specific serine/threonine protein kinase n=1 Tax=Stieleria neptunia TaxID=2527979 RepID=A0A518HJY9_9BACT|nr:protein kinase [Stieleria neptunia]QDV41165.1 Serine/threonine-protein kinase PrkC [Stieleria neptunia]